MPWNLELELAALGENLLKFRQSIFSGGHNGSVDALDPLPILLCQCNSGGETFSSGELGDAFGNCHRQLPTLARITESRFRRAREGSVPIELPMKRAFTGETEERGQWTENAVIHSYNFLVRRSRAEALISGA